jgi:hypothetical protein
MTAPSSPSYRLLCQLEEVQQMPKVSRESAAHVDDHGPIVDRYEDVHGYTVSFITFREDVDATPLMLGLPDDRCQCPHWGYVVTGGLTLRYPDHDEVYDAGDAFYMPPGHVPVGQEPGTELVMFSPTEELRATEDVMKRNMLAMQ